MCWGGLKEGAFGGRTESRGRMGICANKLRGSPLHGIGVVVVHCCGCGTEGREKRLCKLANGFTWRVSRETEVYW